MTRKEKEKLIMDALGFKVGDTLIFADNYLGPDKKFIIKEKENNYILNYDGFILHISALLEYDFKKIIPKRKRGDLLCREIPKCKDCPLFSTRCNYSFENTTLYDMLNKVKKYYMPCGVYEIYKTILDDEVEDE